MPEFGDVLRYPAKHDPEVDWLFMFLGPDDQYVEGPYLRVMLLRVHRDDDLWAPGTVILAGPRELEPVE